MPLGIKKIENFGRKFTSGDFLDLTAHMLAFLSFLNSHSFFSHSAPPPPSPLHNCFLHTHTPPLCVVVGGGGGTCFCSSSININCYGNKMYDPPLQQGSFRWIFKNMTVGGGCWCLCSPAWSFPSSWEKTGIMELKQQKLLLTSSWKKKKSFSLQEDA